MDPDQDIEQISAAYTGPSKRPIADDYIDVKPVVKQLKTSPENMDSDGDDIHIYGEEVRCKDIRPEDKTLLTEKLPHTLDHLIKSILTVDLSPSPEAQMDLNAPPENYVMPEKPNLYQVDTIPKLLDDVKRRFEMSVTRVVEPRVFHVYLKTPYRSNREIGLMDVYCFHLKETCYEEFIQQGDVVQLWPEGPEIPQDTPKLLGYVALQSNRILERSVRSEALLVEMMGGDVPLMTDEICIRMPYNEMLFRNNTYKLHVKHLSLMHDVVIKSKTIFHVAANSSYNYLKQRTFKVLPAGVVISSDPTKFKEVQLEAIQKCFDRNISSTEHNILCLTGNFRTLREIFIEVIREFTTNPETNRFQYLILMGTPIDVRTFIKKLRQDLKFTSKDIISTESKGDICDMAKCYADNELKRCQEELNCCLESNPGMIDLENKISCLSSCLRHLSDLAKKYRSRDSSDEMFSHPLESWDQMYEIQKSMGQATDYLMSKAKVIIGTPEQICNDTPFFAALKKKASVRSNKNQSLSRCLLADAYFLDHIHLLMMNWDFDMKKFILFESLSINKSGKGNLLDSLKNISDKSEEGFFFDTD